MTILMDDEGHYEEPDFSGEDDFANDKEIQRIRLERAEFGKMMDESVDILVSGLNLKETSHVNLKDFTMFKGLQATLTESFESLASPAEMRVCIAFYHTEVSVGRVRSKGEDPYFFGRMKMKTNYPPTYICRETVKEFIHDLVLNQETDFPEHKKFSRRFYVLTKDSHRLKQLLAFKAMDELTEFRDMEIEIQDEYLLFRHSRKPVSREEAKKFVEFAKVLSKIFG